MILSAYKYKYAVLLAYNSSDAQAASKLTGLFAKERIKYLSLPLASTANNYPDLKENLFDAQILVILMSPDFFQSGWDLLEKDSGLFRSPKDEPRIFIPLLLQNCKVPDSIKRYKYLDGGSNPEQAFNVLINIIKAKCEIETVLEEPAALEIKPAKAEKPAAVYEKALTGHRHQIWAVAVSLDGKQALSASMDKTIKLWNAVNGECLKTFGSHDAGVRALALLPGAQEFVSGAEDGNLKHWNLVSGECLRTIKAHTRSILSLAGRPHTRQILSASNDGTLKLWDLDSGGCLLTLRGHGSGIWSALITPNGKLAVSGAADKTIKIWDLEAGKCLLTLDDHMNSVSSLALTPDGQYLLSGSHDKTLRLWDIAAGKCAAVFEGHKEPIWAVASSPDGQVIASASMEHTIKLWELKSGICLQTLRGKKDFNCLAFNPNGHQLLAGGDDNNVNIWRLCGISAIRPQVSTEILPAAAEEPQIRYATAKVVIIGENGAGKTSLCQRLAAGIWDTAVTDQNLKILTLKLPPAPDQPDLQREVLLWDFSGQTQQRLVHQLFWDETVLALVVIDPAKPKPWHELEEWGKKLRTVLKHDPKKILLSLRTDLSQPQIPREDIERFCREQGYAGYFETSAKSGTGIEELKAALAENIPWNQLPWVSTTSLYKGLQEVIVRLKEAGVCLLRYDELRQQLQLSLPDEIFSEKDLYNVVGLLSGKGLVKPLAFGNFVLLCPELLNSYALALIKTACGNQGGLACIPEQDVLKGAFDLNPIKRLNKEDEEVLLWALRQALVDQALCLREDTPGGRQLVFPALFNRQVPEMPNHPQTVLIYRFNGDVDKIYNTLVVRFCYSDSFEKKDFWKNGAEFLTIKGQTAGFVLEKISETCGKIEVFFASGVSDDTKVIFINYIHEHLLRQALNVERERFYICPKCNYPAADREVINLRLQSGKRHLICNFCDARIPLFDLIEQKFAGTKHEKQVQELEKMTQSNLEKESMELILAGQTYLIAREAGQICRLYTNSNNGIDGEIEFVDEEGQGSGRKIYLQLKSNDFYNNRQKEGQIIFSIKNDWLIEHWQNQPVPLFLIARTKDEKIRWMNISQYLRQRPNKKSKQIPFDGEIFNAFTLLNCREGLNNPPMDK
ncbi:MAG: DUF4365 domain-containing protein [Candidatus Schekmanbacteria bacterium]|nr:DUF4365 domain-containing protein [Candidatus Schekmanbacteria bacterium]